MTCPFCGSKAELASVQPVAAIQARVAAFYGLTLSDMRSARRTRGIARPRQVAMYLARHHTERTLPEIGRMFGGKDHTTVIHAIRQIEALRKSDPYINADVSALEAELVH